MLLVTFMSFTRNLWYVVLPGEVGCCAHPLTQHPYHLLCRSALHRVFFCKNTINFAEPQIFLTSGWYAISHISRPSPSEDVFKLHFRMKSFLFEQSNIFQCEYFLGWPKILNEVSASYSYKRYSYEKNPV